MIQQSSKAMLPPSTLHMHQSGLVAMHMEPKIQLPILVLIIVLVKDLIALCKGSYYMTNDIILKNTIKIRFITNTTSSFSPQWGSKT